jgi:hypothetical protein
LAYGKNAALRGGGGGGRVLKVDGALISPQCSFSLEIACNRFS